MDSTNSRTVGSIVHSKILDALEATDLSDLARYSAAFASTCALTACLVFPEAVGQAIRDAAAWQNWLFPKAAVSAVISFNFRRFLEWGASSIAEMEIARENAGKTCFSTVPVLSAERIDGIPTVELISHLFEEGKFSVRDADALKMPRNRYFALANKMEEVGILVRGEKNARILNPDFSRSDVVSILAGCETASELKPLLRKIDEGNFTHSPSLPEMEDEMEELAKDE